jgi:hypothetical protein
MAANEVKIDDGFSTLVTLENLPTVKIYEKSVTPPGISGGGPIDTTTMRNQSLRTQSPKQLKTITPMTMTVAIASEAIEDVKDQINVNQLITVTLPDGSGQTFWGWINEFTPGEFVEGEQPTYTITIEPSNHDNAEPYNEVDLEYIEPSASS